MTNTSLVGVVMTAYDSGSFIAEALGSLMAQSNTEWRCVVVDDGSTDSTVDIVRGIAAQDDRITLVRQDHGGVSRARNAGLATLSPQACYVAFFDSDDRYLGDALESLVAVLDRRPDAVGAFGWAEYMDEHGEPLQLGAHPALQRARRVTRGWRLGDVDPGGDSTFDDVAVAGAIWPSAVALHRRSAITAAGGLDESFTRQGDWELYVRMARLGPFAVLDRQVVWYRRHGSNLTGDVLESCYQQERVRYKAWLSASNSPTQRRVVARGARRIQLADIRRMLRRLRADASSRRPWCVLIDAVGLAMMGAALLHRGPARPSRRRVSWTAAGAHRGRSSPRQADTEGVRLSKQVSGFLIAFGVWSWIIWPTFLKNIWKDPRSWDNGATAFFLVHLALTAASLALGTAIGVLGVLGWLRAGSGGAAQVSAVPADRN